METREVPFRVALVLLLVLGLGMALVAPARALPITDDAIANSTAWNGQRKVVRDSVGRLYVALAVSDPELDEAVRVLTSDDNGATWSPLPRVPDATEKMSAASLAIDSADRVHLAWTELSGANLQVFHAVWVEAEWSPRTQVSATPGYSGFPATAFDRLDRLHVAWYGFDGSTYQVYYRVRDPVGTWDPTEIVSTGLRDANNPSLAIGPDDRPHVAWFLLSGNRLSVVYTSRETEWATVTTLSNPSTFALEPSLAIASDGRIFATWTETYPNGTRAVVTRHRDAGDWSQPTALAWFPTAGGHPVVTLDGQDRGFVFWDQLDDAIRYRIFNGSWGPGVTLAANGTASFPSVRWAAVANPLFSGANRLDVVWTELVDGRYSVVLAGVPVPATGQPPTGPSIPGLPVLVGSILVLVGIVWLLQRRARRFTPKQ